MFNAAMKNCFITSCKFDRAVEAQTRTLIKNRTRSWITGKTKDIKAGKFPVCCECFEDGKMDAEIFDKAYMPPKTAGVFVLLEKFTGITSGFGTARGLKNNIRMKIGGREVLVMDNHNFAASFIIEAFNKGLISKGSKMAHIDGHPDVSGWLWSGEFEFKNYQALKTPEQKFKYIVTKTTINNWQHGPLFCSGIIDGDKWRWYFINPGNQRWYSQNRYFGGRYEKSDHLSSYESGGNDIVDVDIDFLYTLDSKLTPYEKQRVLKSKVPLEIKRRLSEVLSLAREAKVITIATSPCYINQPRAIVYAKWLVEHLKKD